MADTEYTREMTEQEVLDFLAQFEEAALHIAEWPQWMQDAAHEAAATFPKMGTSPDQQKKE
jgi:tRNA A37 threonylcarbamoyladenosine biosynthesis protein TsaE